MSVLSWHGPLGRGVEKRRVLVPSRHYPIPQRSKKNALREKISRYYLAKLLEGEADVRRDRATKSRIRLARFPVIKTLEQFRWDWPTRMNRLQVQNHFRLAFIQDKANLIFLGGVGLGKTHLATALGYTACLQGYSVLFASAIDVINTLAAAKNAGRLKAELKKYTKP